MKLLLIAMGLLLSISVYATDEERLKSEIHAEIDRFASEPRPQWSIDAFTSCMKECDRVAQREMESCKDRVINGKQSMECGKSEAGQIRIRLSECRDRCIKEDSDRVETDWCKRFEAKFGFPWRQCWPETK